MAAVTHLLYIEIILNILILFYTPKQSYFKQNYLNKILLTNYDIFGNRENYNNICNNNIDNSITDTLSKELNASYKINNASLSFSIIILIIAVLEVLINIFMDNIYITYIIKFLFSINLYFINWAMNLAIYVKIKNIRENIDEIGLTNEIRKGIIKVIVLLSICLLYSSFGIGIGIISLANYNGKDEKIKKYDNINIIMEEYRKKDLELNEIISYNHYLLKKNEKLLSIIFTSNDQKILYSVICKNTDKFEVVEQSLFEKYNEYKQGENYYLCGGNQIDAKKTIDENKIKNGDVIVVCTIETPEILSLNALNI